MLDRPKPMCGRCGGGMQLQMFQRIPILKCISCGNIMLDEGDLNRLVGEPADGLAPSPAPPEPGTGSHTLIPEPTDGSMPPLDVTEPTPPDRPTTGDTLVAPALDAPPTDDESLAAADRAPSDKITRRRSLIGNKRKRTAKAPPWQADAETLNPDGEPVDGTPRRSSAPISLGDLGPPPEAQLQDTTLDNQAPPLPAVPTHDDFEDLIDNTTDELFFTTDVPNPDHQEGPTNLYMRPIEDFDPIEFPRPRSNALLYGVLGLGAAIFIGAPVAWMAAQAMSPEAVAPSTDIQPTAALNLPVVPNEPEVVPNEPEVVPDEPEPEATPQRQTQVQADDAPIVRPEPKGPSQGDWVDRGWSAVDSDPAQAEAAFRSALELGSDHALANYGLAYAMLKQGNTEGSVPFLCAASTTSDVELQREVASLIRQHTISCE